MSLGYVTLLKVKLLHEYSIVCYQLNREVMWETTCFHLETEFQKVYSYFGYLIL